MDIRLLTPTSLPRRREPKSGGEFTLSLPKGHCEPSMAIRR